MTVGDFYGVILDLLERHDKPLSMVEIARFLYSKTGATAFDVTSAVNALVRAGRIELVNGPNDTQLFGTAHVNSNKPQPTPEVTQQPAKLD